MLARVGDRLAGNEVVSPGEQYAVERLDADEVERIRPDFVAVVRPHLVERGEYGDILDLGEEARVGPADVELDAWRPLLYGRAEQPDARPPAVGAEGSGEAVAVHAQRVDGLVGSASAGEVFLEDDLSSGGDRRGHDLIAADLGADGLRDPHELFAALTDTDRERVNGALVEANVARLVAFLPERDEEVFDASVRDDARNVLVEGEHIRSAAHDCWRDACRLRWPAPSAGKRRRYVGGDWDVVLGLAGVFRRGGLVELLDVEVAQPDMLVVDEEPPNGAANDYLRGAWRVVFPDESAPRVDSAAGQAPVSQPLLCLAEGYTGGLSLDEAFTGGHEVQSLEGQVGTVRFQPVSPALEEE